MLGSTIVVEAAKKGKRKYGWKGMIVAGIVAFLGQRVVKKKLKRGRTA